MNFKTIGAGIFGTSALVLGGVDASVLEEQPINRTETVAGYVVEAKQVGNVVEADFPWKDQIGIKVKYDLGEPTVAEKLTDKRKKEVITETVTDFEGGFKVDILLNEKPDTNIFCYAIEGAENYDFFYQPPLTSDEIASGSNRPPEIEGSYAVYHKTLRNHVDGEENYATGKVMHIPRPQVWSLSDESTKEWADLSYDEGTGLCVTVPQDFLNKADYPVRVDPTFGYTSVGASLSSTVRTSIVGSFGTKSSAGNVSSVSIYVKLDSSNNWQAGIFDSSGNFLYNTNEITAPTVDSWNVLNFASPPALAAADYLVTIWSDATVGGVTQVAQDAGASGNNVFDNSLGTTYKTWPATINGITSTSIKSIYATYTESGGGGSSTTPNQNIIIFD